jgi:hypothetical protein
MRGKKSVTVLDVLTKIDGYDSGAIMLQLYLRIAADGKSAIAVEAVAPSNPNPNGQPGPTEKCAVPSDWESSPVERKRGVVPYKDLRRRLCGARGTYKWRGGRFQLVR